MKLLVLLFIALFCCQVFSTPLDDLATFVKSQFKGVDDDGETQILKQLIKDLGLTGELQEVLLARELDVADHIDTMTGCANSNSYLVLAAAEIKKKGLLNYVLKKPQQEVKTTIQLAVVYSFLIDTLVNRAVNDLAFFERMYNTLWTNIQGAKFQFNTFQKAKLYSVREGLSLVLRELKSGKAANTLANSLVLPVNVMEAVIQDRHMGLYDNADAGMPLATYNPTSQVNRQTGSGPRTLSQNGKVVETHYPLAKLWDDLYSTWNMAFCSHYTNFPFYFAKLMNPSVGCYQEAPQQYIMKRGIGLYVHLVFSAHFANKNIAPYSSIDWFNEAFSKEFGRVNKISSADYSSRVDRLDPGSRNRGLAIISEAQKKLSQTITVVENGISRAAGAVMGAARSVANAVHIGGRRRRRHA